MVTVIYFALIVIAIVFGGLIRVGSAVASIPISFSASTNLLAAIARSEFKNTGFE
jgi:hypothetical protein